MFFDARCTISRSRFLIAIVAILVSNTAIAVFKDTEHGAISEIVEQKTESKKDSLAENVSFEPRLTHFIQGSDDDRIDTEQGGKLDITIKVNLHGMDVWKGAALVIRGESNYGYSVNGQGGSIIPVNLGSAYPGETGDDRNDINSFFLAQRLSETKTLTIGKINMLDFSIRRGSGGAGLDFFWNVALVAPPSGLVPPYIFGGIFTDSNPSLKYTLALYDANSAVNRSGFEDPFEDGANLLLTVDFPVTIGGKPGFQGFKIAYSSKDELDQQDIFLAADPNQPADTKNRYYIAYQFKNFIVENPAIANGGWGIFGQFGLSDNPNEFDVTWALGVGGNSLTRSRPLDKWGIGFFDFSISDDIVDGVSPFGFELTGERGMEAFYDFAVGDSLFIGADIQYIDPSLETSDSFVLYGFRASYRFQ